MRYTTIINEETYEIEILADGRVRVNGGEAQQIDFLALDDSLYSFIRENQSYELAIEDLKDSYDVLLDGRLYASRVFDERAVLMMNRRGGFEVNSGEVHSPMPGLIVSVNVDRGQAVTKGDTIIILESMKMQNELKAPCDGAVSNIAVQAGQTVDKGQLLVLIDDGA